MFPIGQQDITILEQSLIPDKNSRQSQQEAFNALKIAAEMILQGLNTATKEAWCGIYFAIFNRKFIIF